MSYGVSSTISSYLTGRIVSYVPRYVVMVMNFVLMLGLFVFLLMWDREPSYMVVFVVPVLWGVCDAVWNIITTSKCSVCAFSCSAVVSVELFS